jgi:lysozyme
MKTGPDGLRLITTFEGKPRLSARLCEGGRWELGYGCTFWPPSEGYPDGRPVREGQTILPDHVQPLLAHALHTFEQVVNSRVTVELTQYQFDALVALVFNIGDAQFATSSVLRLTNERRFEDAARAFGMWTKATSEVDANGNHWRGPSGEPCRYTRALRGLLRRHYAEGCVYSGFDFEEACADDAISLRSEKLWDEPNNRWHDRVLWDQTTPFGQVLETARKHPLPMLLTEPAGSVTVIMDAAPPPAPKPAPVVTPAPIPRYPAAPMPPPAVTVATKAAPKPAPAPTPISLPVGTKSKSPNTVQPSEVPYKIDPNAGLKPLEESDRAKGYVVQQVGISVIRLGALGMFGSTVQSGAQVLQGDPVLSNMVLIAFVAAGVAIVGFTIKTYGDWKRKRAEKAAVQALF